jgi:hypothetical protein
MMLGFMFLSLIGDRRGRIMNIERKEIKERPHKLEDAWTIEKEQYIECHLSDEAKEFMLKYGRKEMTWLDNYYPTDKPCCICGKEGNNGLEPRFGYVVCEEHSKLTPVEVSDFVKEKE